MLVNKITTGFVIQTYNTQTNKCIRQEFVAGDQVEWEDEDGTPIIGPADEDVDIEILPYQSFDMAPLEE